MRVPIGTYATVGLLWAGTASGQSNCTIPSLLEDPLFAYGTVPDTVFINTAGGNASSTDVRAAADTWNVCTTRPTVTLTNTPTPDDVEGPSETWTVKIDTKANLGVDSSAAVCAVADFASKTIKIFSDRAAFSCPGDDEIQRLIQHELGHVFRLGDATSAECRDVVPASVMANKTNAKVYPEETCRDLRREVEREECSVVSMATENCTLVATEDCTLVPGR